VGKSPLWDNPDFLNDCRTMRSKAVREKWNVSAGLVADVRRGYRAPRADEAAYTVGSGSVTLPSVTAQADESFSEDFKGNVNLAKTIDRVIPLTEWLDDLRARGYDPDDFTYSYSNSVWQSASGQPLYANKFSAVKKAPKSGTDLAETFSLSHFYAEAAKIAEREYPKPVARPGRGTVVVISDWQIGKTGRRGGTAELLARLEDARGKVAEELERREPQQILLLDGGDGIENFESGGNPMHTNDMSLPDQLDAYSTELLKFVRLCDQHAETQVGAVPSNHSAWRRGKQNLGRPSDDFGVYVHKQVAKHFDDIQWHFPDEYDESLCVDFAGTPIGLVHGHQFSPGKAIDWWAQQAFGDQAVSRADVMISGHYHSFGAGVAGQNTFTGRERMWLGAPTLDSGSDWYRNVKGRDSLPGTMIFDVTEIGFDLGSLKIV